MLRQFLINLRKKHLVCQEERRTNGVGSVLSKPYYRANNNATRKGRELLSRT